MNYDPSTINPLLKPIGIILSALKRLEDCPLQERESDTEAELLISPEFADGIADLKPGDKIVLLTWMHLADRNELKTQPRNNINAPFTGVFSTRSPNRPNPIGLHQVTVLSVADNLVKVSGLEVLDQTPLIDIKPVIG
ncbi:tRNA (N6-threonylcarbamoyladenosine(37)-N6)-methyltransferase TrmO [Mucilaginibacter calamicampi]|uniref:tRNA (N6-threonylcarbamoyladenosine(37)-N6)-methyltransferase TrmO n=1 Tax=Mucilaginibacter calamicampi TaxID=1302352 RepID=A0ABW2YSK1_9SPHI